jgi:hypothetical protein
MILQILFIVSFLFNLALIYMLLRAIRKIDSLEDTLDYLYFSITEVLHTIRVLDEKQMFEKDDEVGEVFLKITETVNYLRPILYGSLLDGKTEETRIG